MKFKGYRRPDGSVGVRNHILIIPSVFCANKTVESIARQVKGAIPITHPVGCGQIGYDFELTARTLIAMGNHPNVAAVLVVGLGCERFKPTELYEGIKKSGKPVEMIVIQDEGGTSSTIDKGVKIALGFAKKELAKTPEDCDFSELTVAVKCGGTDATSGLAANPAVGEMADLIVSNGGSVILSELNELLGTEDMLASRAVNKEVADKVYSAVYGIEEKMRKKIDTQYEGRNELISPGNYDGGVSNIVEKALGGVYKGGTSPVVDVIEYSIPPEKGKKGLFLMNYESHDGEVVTGMVGSGAQIVVFTSGRGNPTGFPFVPVIKVTGNDVMYQKMIQNFDFDASGIIKGENSLEETGKNLFQLLNNVANGELTTAELLEADELFCIARA
ncbi:UxaA family hydrolase [Gudongella sp. DL1XJH-153]|uniref:UxaA family hydrolase n=1 Tax=Gudongella sp. DL1XJH-153 TaxID=3409804 RepID=UPI003BB4C387